VAFVAAALLYPVAPLAQAIQRSMREIEKANNLQEARRILTEIGFPPLLSDTPEKIWAALKAKHEEAEENSDLLTKLLKALKITP